MCNNSAISAQVKQQFKTFLAVGIATQARKSNYYLSWRLILILSWPIWFICLLR